MVCCACRMLPFNRAASYSVDIAERNPNPARATIITSTNTTISTTPRRVGLVNMEERERNSELRWRQSEDAELTRGHPLRLIGGMFKMSEGHAHAARRIFISRPPVRMHRLRPPVPASGPVMGCRRIMRSICESGSLPADRLLDHLSKRGADDDGAVDDGHQSLRQAVSPANCSRRRTAVSFSRSAALTSRIRIRIATGSPCC